MAGCEGGITRSESKVLENQRNFYGAWLQVYVKLGSLRKAFTIFSYWSHNYC